MKDSALAEPTFAEANRSLKASFRWVRIAEWVLLVLLTAYLGLHTLPRAWQKLNTDFPNYYLTARLAHEGNSTSRVYEWIWLQRQKDHREIDQRVVGMVPITPFSTLAVWPLTSMSPLIAKRCWLILNLGLLCISGTLMRSLTQLPWRRVALVAALSFPLHRNFLYGQYYVLLLFVLALACWLYIHQRRFLAGLMVGLGFGLKLFPVLYLLYFLRKKDLRALAGGLAGSAGAVAASIAVFGWELNRVYLLQVVPWALRGEALNPYAFGTSSIATLLHRLFIYEPQWNPYPLLHEPWIFAILFPLLQTLVFAPALLLAEPTSTSPKRVRLEWAAILIASLTISTLSASYHFTLLILPVCLLWEASLALKRPYAAGVLLLLYLVIGYPGWKTTGGAGWLALLNVQRLYALILLCGFAYGLLAIQKRGQTARRERRVWAAAFALMIVFGIVIGLRHQRGLYADYQWRLQVADDMLMAAGPVTQHDTVLFTELSLDGYHTALDRGGVVQFSSSRNDQLGVAAVGEKQWVEQVGRESSIVSIPPSREELRQAEFPVASFDGQWLAYLREEHGRARIWFHALGQPESKDRAITPPELDVLEMCFRSGTALVFSATSANGRPELYLLDQAGTLSALGADEARYPSVSPDGQWLAYSRLEGGNWNLWIRELHSGKTRRITHAECNDIEPVWQSDSQTLIYASDCGRALWFTALCRRRVIL